MKVSRNRHFFFLKTFFNVILSVLSAWLLPGDEEYLVLVEPDQPAGGHAVHHGAAVHVHRVQELVVQVLQQYRSS